MSIETSKLRPGDLVIVYSPSRPDGSGLGGSSSGMYLVIESSDYFANVVPADSLNQAYALKVASADIVAHVRPASADVGKLPPARAFDLSAPASVAVTATAPDAEPEAADVLLHVVEAGRQFYELSKAGARRGSSETVRYERGPSPVPCRGPNAPACYPLLVRRSDVGRLLGGTPGAHEPGQLPLMGDE